MKVHMTFTWFNFFFFFTQYHPNKHPGIKQIIQVLKIVLVYHITKQKVESAATISAHVNIGSQQQSSACLILNNATSSLLVKDSVTTLSALYNITWFQGILHSTISADVADWLRLRIHHRI